MNCLQTPERTITNDFPALYRIEKRKVIKPCALKEPRKCAMAVMLGQRLFYSGHAVPIQRHPNRSTQDCLALAPESGSRESRRRERPSCVCSDKTRPH